MAHVEQVGLLQQAVDHFAPASPVRQALEAGEMVQQLIGGDLGIDPEVLRQVAQQAADLVFFVQHVQFTQEHRAGIAFLQRCQRTHQGGLAGAIGAEQAKHPGRDRERDIVQGDHAIGIGL